MEELTIDGKIYLSSKKAAKVTGYAKDYVGQLCREGRVEAKLVGRSWYVYEPSIKEHRFNDERKKGESKNLAKKEAETEIHQSEKTNIQAVWQEPIYAVEVPQPLPIIEPKPDPEPEETGSPRPLSEMQSTWQEWFSDRSPQGAEPRPTEPVPEAPEAYEMPEVHAEEESIPVRVIVSDIAPKREEQSTERLVARAPYAQAALSRGSIRPRKQRIGTRSPLIAKAALCGLIVIAGSIMLVATGLLETLHLGGGTHLPILDYFEGSTFVEKQ